LKGTTMNIANMGTIVEIYEEHAVKELVDELVKKVADKVYEIIRDTPSDHFRVPVKLAYLDFHKEVIQKCQQEGIELDVVTSHVVAFLTKVRPCPIKESLLSALVGDDRGCGSMHPQIRQRVSDTLDQFFDQYNVTKKEPDKPVPKQTLPPVSEAEKIIEDKAWLYTEPENPAERTRKMYDRKCKTCQHVTLLPSSGKYYCLEWATHVTLEQAGNYHHCTGYLPTEKEQQ